MHSIHMHQLMPILNIAISQAQSMVQASARLSVLDIRVLLWLHGGAVWMHSSIYSVLPQSVQRVPGSALHVQHTTCPDLRELVKGL